MKEEVFINSEEEGLSNTLAIIGLFIAVLLVVFFIDTMGSCSLRNNLFLKPLCGYVLPSNMQIVSDGNKYAVAVDKGYLGIEYLNDGGLGEIYCWYPEVSKPTLLWSECKAKALAKKYIQQEQERQFKGEGWDDSEFK